MGKLHRIRKAFNRLSEEDKERLNSLAKTYWSCPSAVFSYRTNAVEFRFSWHHSYRRFVRKLCREHFGRVGQAD
jgi:hypothetical protein